MSIKIKDFLSRLSLPKKYFSDDFLIIEKFKEESDIFLKLLTECKGDEFEENNQKLIQNQFDPLIDFASSMVENILDVFKHHESSNPKLAQEKFDFLMDKIREDIFISTIDDWVALKINGKSIRTRFRLTPGHRYYRVRPVEYESDYIKNNANELFHIPLTKRAYSNNERFSLTGFPSLYLASMLPLAWQECGYPQKYYFSEFQYNHKIDYVNEKRLYDDEFKFIALYSPDEINAWGTSIKFSDFEIWLSAIVRYIKMYPLILACSFVNQSGKVPYKQEYIIPQMLMQWVQRNSDFAQGISYFTCTDTTTQTSMWCAYNIVIPALPPFDAQKYSSTLREHFCWSLPQYFIAPIADTQRNKDDRRFIYDFLSNIRSATRMYIFPTALHNHLIKIMNICCSLLSLLDNGNSINLELALHMLETLHTNYENLKKENIESMVESAENNKSDIAFNSTQNIEDVFRTFRDICYDFFAEQRGKNSIGKLIEKYKWISWNDFHPHSELEIIFSDPSTIREAIEWCNKNHLLHRQTQLKSDEASLKYLDNICSKFGFSLSDFWDTYKDDITWMKENIISIKYPIIVKHDDIGVYSSKGTTPNEFCQIGFNKDELSKLLKQL